MRVTSRPDSLRRFLFIICTIVAPVILLMGLNRAIRAKPQEVSAPICQQAANRVLNPDFEQGIEEHWTESGPLNDCSFSPDNVAYQGDIAAEISPETTTDEDCMLLSDLIPTDDDVLQPGMFYDYSTWVRADSGGHAYLSITFW